jgi:hypothetical protein
VKILTAPVYAGLGPALAAGCLRNKHGIAAGRQTVRQWMMGAKLWRGRKAKVNNHRLQGGGLR